MNNKLVIVGIVTEKKQKIHIYLQIYSWKNMQ